MWSLSSSPSSSRPSSRNTSRGADSPLGSFVSRSPSPYYHLQTETYDNDQPEWRDNVKVGDRVIVRSSFGDAKTGILQYVGPVDFAKGVWAGVELFYPQGKNDGTVRGREYFRCPHPYGIFVPIRKVDLSPVNGIKGLQQTKWMADEHENHHHNHGVNKNCGVHDKILWNTRAVMGTKVTGVRNPALPMY